MDSENKNLKMKINPTNASAPETGIDTDKIFLDNIIEAAEVGGIDISGLTSLSNSAQNREQTFQLLDSMAHDTLISSVLETYAEDTVQPNDKGQCIWVEADNGKILDYVSWLMDTLNIDKHIYQWAHCLITYGDVYVRLYRKSDVEEDKLFKKPNKTAQLNESREPLNEDVKLRVYEDSDKYITYVQMVDNPGEMFDLQKFGKTHGYIKTPINIIQQTSDELYNYITKYKMKQNDVEIFDAMSFVHGCLETTSQRQPETVDIFMDSMIRDNAEDPDHLTSDSMTSSYSVKRGQSILYNSFRIWRELSLLEMSALLNRLTKSSVVRILNIDVNDMPKEKVRPFIEQLKQKIEQKSAINVGTSMGEYTNPGPIENTIYVPTHGTNGSISAQNIGGDFDPKSLVDIEYFRDELFGNLKIPKQFFGFTSDGAMFDTGRSLSIISARYGKAIRNIQNVLCQMVTDLINLFLIDRGLDNYVNKFAIRMQDPVTQEELDRRANTETRVRYVSDLMSQLGDIDDPIIKLKIYKTLLADVVDDTEIMRYLQDYIDKLEEKAKPKVDENGNKVEGEELPDFGGEGSSGGGFDMGSTESDAGLPAMEEAPAMETFDDEEDDEKEIINEESDDEEILPSPDDLNIDFTKKYEKED